MSADILTLIREKGEHCSKGKKRIADYILEHYDQAAFMTASALGKLVQVSESTVVRFAGELGCKGYPELQRALQDMVMNRLTNVQRIEVGKSQILHEDPLTAVLQQDMDCIRGTLQTLDPRAFADAVETLLAGKRIYIMGARASAALASFAAYYFNYIFDDVRLIQGSSEGELLQQLVRIGPGDCLLCISFPRYCAAVNHGLQFAHEGGAKTIVLTDSGASPLIPWSDVLLATKCEMLSLADSLVAPMSVINALIAALASERKQHTRQTFDKLEEIWDRYHVYEKNCQ